jgi:hypothetical protein
MDDFAREKLQRQQQLENDRAIWDSHWREVAERVLPRQDDFQRVRAVEGEKRMEKVFDSTAIVAADRSASAVDSLITPATQQYHELEPEDDSLLEDYETRRYLEELNRMLFRSRYRPIANFASQAHECYVSLMVFGTLGMFIDDVLGIGIRYKSIALSELYIAENSAGIVDYVHRKFPMTARQAIQKWGMDAMPPAIKQAFEKTPFQKFDFVHCVYPNDEMKHGRKDYRGMPWASAYISVEGQATLSKGGYRTMPYAVSRHVTAPRETYGRSPAMQALPDIKMLNEMEKTFIRVGHRIAEPPLLLYGDGVLSGFSLRPGALNYGGVNEQGQELIKQMEVKGNLPIAFEMSEAKRKSIQDSFFVTLFQILVQNPQMTATEALIRAQEKGQLLAPTVGRQQTEFIGPTIDREIDVLSASDSLPPMPRRLAMSGGGVKVKYTAPLNRLRRAEDGVAIQRTLEQVRPLAEIDATILDPFNFDATVRELADINGVPIRVMRSVDEVAQIRAERKQAQQAQQMAELADTAGSAIAKVGKGAQLMSQAQQPQQAEAPPV